MAARRWFDLSKSYRRRITAYAKANPDLGKTPGQIWHDPDLRRVATGHAATPRSPAQALRDPRRYLDYIRRNYDKVDALADTTRGERLSLQAINRQVDVGEIPVALYRPADGMRRMTFMDLEGAEEYLRPVQHLVDQRMAWIVPVRRFRSRDFDYEVWILRSTP